jgi:hypothetical protein
MAQVAIVVTLKSDAEERARQLIERGPPFDLAESGFTRHTIFLSAGEVVFAFEGREVEWRLDELVDRPFSLVREALEHWRPLVAGPPRIARVAYEWNSEPARSDGDA